MKASLQSFCVVSMFCFAFDAVEFSDAVEDIFCDEVALFCGNDKATAGVHPATQSNDTGHGRDGVVGSIAVRHPVREEPAKRVAWFNFFGCFFSGIIVWSRQAQHFSQFFRAASANVEKHLISPTQPHMVRLPSKVGSGVSSTCTKAPASTWSRIARAISERNAANRAARSESCESDKSDPIARKSPNMRPNGSSMTYLRNIASMMVSSEYFPFGTIVGGGGATKTTSRVSGNPQSSRLHISHTNSAAM